MKLANAQALLARLGRGIGRFSDNLEAMRSHFLFRKHFRKLEKEKKQAATSAVNTKKQPL